MGTAIEFDLNNALQLWLERLGQSPQFKVENLKELESHVRDSVVQLQSKGLSSEESFLIATRRAGTPAELEPEFAKINRSPWNIFIEVLILVVFSINCFFLWGILLLPRMMLPAMQGMPAFTQLLEDLRCGLAVPPILALVYCVYGWTRKSLRGNSWIGLFAVTMAILILLALPILIGVFIALIAFIDSLPAALLKPH